MLPFIENNKNSFYGGIISSLFTGLAIFLIGNISGYQAKQLIASSLPGINMLCNTIVLASATILALLLTLLGVSSGSETKLDKSYYKSVLLIAKIDTILFVGALILFQLFNIPITESDAVPTSWFVSIYWTTLFFSSLLSGMMITVILLLYTSVTNIIKIVGLDTDMGIGGNSKENKQEDDKL